MYRLLNDVRGIMLMMPVLLWNLLRHKYPHNLLADDRNLFRIWVYSTVVWCSATVVEGHNNRVDGCVIVSMNEEVLTNVGRPRPSSRLRLVTRVPIMSVSCRLSCHHNDHVGEVSCYNDDYVSSCHHYYHAYDLLS